MSHLGRPKGKPEEKFKMDPAARKLEELIGAKVKKFDDIYVSISVNIKLIILEYFKNLNWYVCIRNILKWNWILFFVPIRYTFLFQSSHLL